MAGVWLKVKWLLLALALLHLFSFSQYVAGKLEDRNGLQFATGEPVAGDFINLYSAAHLALTGRAADIYLPDRFVAFEKTIIPDDIGVRLWAYPPHSLLLIWPFGSVGFVAALVLWSLLGLGVLVLGARRIGFGWLETAILVLAPGTLHSLFFGQTGNLVTGGMLLALSARRGTDLVSALSAALLTVKPQIGFLLPLLWAVQRRWRLIAVTAALAALLVGLSVLFFGTGSWHDYVAHSLSLLSLLEREGEGPFLMMIPSLFISLRVLGIDADLAFPLHLAFAAIVAALLVWRLLVVKDPLRQMTMVLLATALISPYLHSYDLTLIAAAALLVGSLYVRALNAGSLLVAILVVAGWGLPNILLMLNLYGVPASPLIIAALFAVVAWLPAPLPESDGDHRS